MTDERPLAVDLFTGLHGWAKGLIAAGWRVVGFDIEDMSKMLGEPKPEHFSLVIQDVLTIHGAQLKDARLIVGSSPCTKYSYMAMPWTRAKSLAEWYRDPEHAERLTELNALYHAQFRIQREASEAAGQHIPMVVENVRGAIPWVGRSRANFGSYHLWGDVPALMPHPAGKSAIKAPGLGNGWVHPDDPRHTPGLDFTRLAARSEEDGRKVPGFRFDGSGKSFQSASVEGMKSEGAIPHIRDGEPHTKHLTNPAEHRKYDMPGDTKPPARVSEKGPAEGRKRDGTGKGRDCDRPFGWAPPDTSSASPRRKAASAKIAKIPFTLAHWIGKTYLPRADEMENPDGR